MPNNLKSDLLNSIATAKYYEEMELVKLAQDPAMSYKEKIAQMNAVLANLAVMNAKIDLTNFYFPEQPAQQAPQQPPAEQSVQQPPVGRVIQGQSHGE